MRIMFTHIHYTVFLIELWGAMSEALLHASVYTRFRHVHCYDTIWNEFESNNIHPYYLSRVYLCVMYKLCTWFARTCRVFFANARVSLWCRYRHFLFTMSECRARTIEPLRRWVRTRMIGTISGGYTSGRMSLVLYETTFLCRVCCIFIVCA